MSRAVWLAAAAAILPVAALAAAETPPAAGTFAPPPIPLLLTRTLRHMLTDGKAVVTRRSYRVQFVAEPGGFRIEGALADVAVEVPPGLDALAELERRRPDPGMFPMHLDAHGTILPAPDPAPTSQQRLAIGVTAAAVAKLDLPTADTAQALSFVSQFQKQPYRTGWPQDLFHPAAGTRREQRAIPLADGTQGQVTTEVEAKADRASGLLATFTRKVTTDLGGDTRVVIEEWTLVSAP
ncbi:MAG: hypothetical protein JF595_00145 [Sphingomonadales bacterium]|nr:hypothetical protein [Sphingomonadales bacterium]